MSRKISVFEDSHASPSTYIKKSIARLLVRRLLAVWVQHNVSIRRVSGRDLPPGILTRRVPPEAKPSTYIPKELPPAELPGLKFTLPKGVPSQVIFLARAARMIAENAAR